CRWAATPTRRPARWPSSSRPRADRRAGRRRRGRSREEGRDLPGDGPVPSPGGGDPRPGARPPAHHHPAGRDAHARARTRPTRRGGTLTDEHHHLLARWAADCAEHVLHLFEGAAPEDGRPRAAVEAARAWARGELRMMEARALGGHAMGAARPWAGAPRFAA